jgi:hypothetical protein
MKCGFQNIFLKPAITPANPFEPKNARAFPGEVGTGSPSGNATKQRDRALS